MPRQQKERKPILTGFKLKQGGQLSQVEIEKMITMVPEKLLLVGQNTKILEPERKKKEERFPPLDGLDPIQYVELHCDKVKTKKHVDPLFKQIAGDEIV